MKETLDTVYVLVLIVIAIGGFFGGNAYFAKRVTNNFDKKYDADRIERAAERAAAKQEADDREAARMQAIINLQEGFVAVGHVAQKTAEAHLARCGPNAEIREALDTYNKVRVKGDAQLRLDAAKYSQRDSRVAQ